MVGWTAQQSKVDKVVLNLGVEGSNPLGQQGRAPPSSVVPGTRCQDERLKSNLRGGAAWENQNHRPGGQGKSELGTEAQKGGTAP